MLHHISLAVALSRTGVSFIARNVGSGLLIAASALGGCGSSKQSPSSPPPPVAATAPTSHMGHWVQDQRLRVVMAELGRHSPSWPQDLPQDPEDKEGASAGRQYREVSTLAESLAAASEQIPELAPALKLGEADRRGFVAEALFLHDQARQLQEAATAHRIEQMQRLMNGINSTCISCHSRYRDISGQLNSGRAALTLD